MPYRIQQRVMDFDHMQVCITFTHLLHDSLSRNLASVCPRRERLLGAHVSESMSIQSALNVHMDGIDMSPIFYDGI
jgi:hypothetical protein